MRKCRNIIFLNFIDVAVMPVCPPATLTEVPCRPLPRAQGVNVSVPSSPHLSLCMTMDDEGAKPLCQTRALSFTPWSLLDHTCPVVFSANTCARIVWGIYHSVGFTVLLFHWVFRQPFYPSFAASPPAFLSPDTLPQKWRPLMIIARAADSSGAGRGSPGMIVEQSEDQYQHHAIV